MATKKANSQKLSKIAEDTKIPTLDIEPLKLSENTYNVYGNSYDVPTLIQFAKEKGYKPFDMPLVSIYIGSEPFRITDFAQFLYHIKRVDNVSLEYPILIDDHGYICDGWHRVAKAFLEGKKTIKAIRLLEMPEASGKVDSK